MTHPFSSQIHALDCKLRVETDPHERSCLKHDMAQLKGGIDRPNGKRFIGRQIAVRSGTYKPPEAKWLKRALHLDADYEPAEKR